MQLTLLESDRSLLRSAECATLSIVAHAAAVWIALATATGTFRLPTDEREARAMFLLPPDRVDAPALSARGVDGLVAATYVVDTTGRVDTMTIKVMQSDDPRFTESVRTALGQAAFRPAKRAGTSVRQLVQQRFRFKLAQPSGV